MVENYVRFPQQPQQQQQQQQQQQVTTIKLQIYAIDNLSNFWPNNEIKDMLEGTSRTEKDITYKLSVEKTNDLSKIKSNILAIAMWIAVYNEGDGMSILIKNLEEFKLVTSKIFY